MAKQASGASEEILLQNLRFTGKESDKAEKFGAEKWKRTEEQQRDLPRRRNKNERRGRKVAQGIS
jgi:hypothetical protein